MVATSEKSLCGLNCEGELVGNSRLDGVLVICTRNRIEDLRQCLGALGTCTDAPPLVLIVDASDGSETEELCIGLTQYGQLPFLIRYIRTTPGLTHQRNVGLAECDHDSGIVFFVDDDCLPQDGYFESLRQVFRSQPSCVGVGSAVVTVSSKGVPSMARITGATRVANFLRRLLGLRAAPYTINRATSNGPLLKPRQFPVRSEWLTGGAMAYRIKAAQTTRFDEDRLHGYAMGEDVEFSVRISAHGSLWIAPDVVMPHTASEVSSPDMRSLFRMYTVNRHHMVASNPDRFSRFALRRTLLATAMLELAAGRPQSALGIFDGFRASQV